MSNYDKMGKKQLLEEAKRVGLTGRHEYNVSQLRVALNAIAAAGPPPEEPKAEAVTAELPDVKPLPNIQVGREAMASTWWVPKDYPDSAPLEVEDHGHYVVRVIDGDTMTKQYLYDRFNPVAPPKA